MGAGAAAGRAEIACKLRSRSPRLRRACFPPPVGETGLHRQQLSQRLPAMCAMPCATRARTVGAIVVVHQQLSKHLPPLWQQLPQQLPAVCEIPCTKRTMPVRVIVGVRQQLPQQLPRLLRFPRETHDIGEGNCYGQIFRNLIIYSLLNSQQLPDYPGVF